MAKAVLIMDMPESCDMCDFADDTQPPRHGERTLYCNAPGIGDDVTDYIACRPDWCPLRELPERKERRVGEHGERMFRAGFNACLGEILGEKKMENKHTMSDLYQMQSLPLSTKISMTARRINEWVDEFGEDGVYLSFSGGKDSTVLGHIIREVCGYKNIPFVFVDVPTQYTELKEFAKTFDNLVILKPKISFAEVCEKYGFPMISKEVSNCVSGARKYVKYLDSQKSNSTILTDRQTDRQCRTLAIWQTC